MIKSALLLTTVLLATALTFTPTGFAAWGVWCSENCGVGFECSIALHSDECDNPEDYGMGANLTCMNCTPVPR